MTKNRKEQVYNCLEILGTCSQYDSKSKQYVLDASKVNSLSWSVAWTIVILALEDKILTDEQVTDYFVIAANKE